MKAYQDGYEARKAAKSISCNPFNTLQPQHTEWDNGWLDRRDYEMIPATRRAYGYGERHPRNTYR
jgi:ribosome modulation factor